MMYVLTHEELKALQAKGDREPRLGREEFQKLCTLIADTMPVVRSWSGGQSDAPIPWGCILSVRSSWCCDQCPVRDICEYPGKRWSK